MSSKDSGIKRVRIKEKKKIIEAKKKGPLKSPEELNERRISKGWKMEIKEEAECMIEKEELLVLISKMWE
jgi:hypothetical protein